jgi:hypothetical protein
MQASLLSNIRSKPEQGLLFNYSNLQHLRDYQPRLNHPHLVKLAQIPMRLEQNAVRIWTHIAQSVLTGTGNGANTANSSSIFDTNGINREIRTAYERFIDSLYHLSDHAHFTGSFIDAYDIFISGVFYVQLEQRLGAGQELRHGNINNVINKCCTVLAGIESRFGAVKAFRRVLRDFAALATGQSSSGSAESV